MKYPNGDVIRRSDRVWWDGGLAVGYVARVLADMTEAVAHGLSEPSVLISTTSDLGMGAPYVAYPERGLADDGVEPLSQVEGVQVDAILRLVADRLGLCDGSSLGVSRTSEHGVVTSWQVIRYEGPQRFVYSLSPSLDGIHQGVVEDAKWLYL